LVKLESACTRALRLLARFAALAAAGKRPRRSRREVRWPLLAYAGAIVLLSHSRRRLGLPRPLMVPVASTTPLAVAAAFPRGKLQYGVTWVSYVWLFKVAWEIPYDKPEKLRPRLRRDYPIRLDRALGGGEPPGVLLQRVLRDPRRLGFLDWLLTGLHYGLWLAPHAALGWILVRDERRFPRVAGRLAAVYHFTTLGYWYLPTTPPWWASEEEGRLGGEVRRVTREVGHALKAKLPGKEPSSEEGDAGDPLQEGNPWGSMPSDAFPAALITARSLGEISPAVGRVAFALTALDGFVLVYLGEHYVTDLIAGLLLVELIWRGEPLALPLVRLGTTSLRALERLVD